MRDYKYLLDRPTKQESILEAICTGLAFLASLASLTFLLALLEALT